MYTVMVDTMATVLVRVAFVKRGRGMLHREMSSER